MTPIFSRMLTLTWLIAAVHAAPRTDVLMIAVDDMRPQLSW